MQKCSEDVLVCAQRGCEPRHVLGRLCRSARTVHGGARSKTLEMSHACFASDVTHLRTTGAR